MKKYPAIYILHSSQWQSQKYFYFHLYCHPHSLQPHRISPHRWHHFHNHNHHCYHRFCHCRHHSCHCCRTLIPSRLQKIITSYIVLSTPPQSHWHCLNPPPKMQELFKSFDDAQLPTVHFNQWLPIPPHCHCCLRNNLMTILRYCHNQHTHLPLFQSMGFVYEWRVLSFLIF